MALKLTDSFLTMNKICILFAAPIGSGKSPIANYLSYKLNLPIFNNDLIRVEVKEDLLEMNDKEYEKRRSQRVEEMVQSGNSFIYDASIDRKWSKLKPMILEQNYTPFLISLDFSREKLVVIYKAKGYDQFDALDRTIEDHMKFVEEFEEDISIKLSDEEFPNRLEIILKATKEFQVRPN